MSLRAFHILFVVVSTLLLIGFGIWSFLEYSKVGGNWNLILGVASVAGAAGLIVYGKWFLDKIKKSDVS